MYFRLTLISFFFLLILFACTEKSEQIYHVDVTPPTAKQTPKELVANGHTRIDNYYWLNQREDPEVLAYLNAENDYFDTLMAHTNDFQEKLFQEIKGRIKEEDQSVPYQLGEYFYYTRYETGNEYAIYCRKKGSMDATEEVVVNGNEWAKGHEFFSLAGTRVSEDHNLVAFPIDTVGRRYYTLHFKNLTTGEALPDLLPDITNNATWANDNKTLFYTKQDPQTLRWDRIYKHVLGSDPSADELIYEEKDSTFSCYVTKSKSKKYIFIGSNSTLSTEWRYVDANKPDQDFKVFQSRERNHEYSIDHFEGHFYVLTNLDEAKNYKLMKTPVGKTTKDNWKEVIAHRQEVLLEGMEIFKDYLVLDERSEGLTKLRVIRWDDNSEHYLDFGEPTYAAYIAYNPQFDTQMLRYGYTSLTTPNSTYDYEMATKEKTLLKQTEVLGGFSSDNYVTERLNATARDGVQVPISLVYRKGLEKNGQNPLLQYGYGSYGYSMEASFRSSVVSLLDRGFVYAIAHIRGGQEMGRQWYEDGKLLKKKNTFNDFVDCSQYLIKQNYSSSEKLFAMGGSAGGLLMGAVVNQAPNLYKGVVAAVPFVDVMTTMLDETIPLTTGEYDEWGNPNEKEYYDYMLSYSPYDQVEAKNYPNMLVTTGLHDSQVQYWEPAKWVAKLREMKTDNNVLLLHTNMEAGHGGATGRFKRFRETARNYVFLMDLIGIKE